MASRTIHRLCRLTLLAMIIVTGLNAGPARAESADTPPLTAAQLEQLVAPIALYPDALMAQVLMAATYPLEVVEAARWSKDNPAVKGQALEDVMQKQSWDPSVKALTAVPQTLAMMNDKLDWTQQLGDVFLAQQQDLLDAVQRLRARADAAGNLKTTPQQKVAKVAAPPASGAGPAQTVYTIEPATPGEYAVPIYDPGVVYGTWPYPNYAPFYWYPPGFVGSGALSFAAGVGVGWAIWGRVDWWQHRVNVNVNRYNRFNHTNITNNTWIHNAAHRHGVPYRDRNVANRFADQNREAAREAFRNKANTERGDLQKQGETRRSEAKGARKGEAKREGAKREGAKSGERRRSAEHKPAPRREATHTRARASHGGGGHRGGGGGHRGGGRRR
jgi:hypothetical protein